MTRRTPLRNPKVSVILPTYNRAPYLTQAIDSIRAQTLKDWELIVVDDASSDTTAQVVRAFAQQDPRIRLCRHSKNQGVAACRNTGLKQAIGTYIAFQDDDDISHPERLAKQADYLDNHPHTAIVTAGAVYFHGRTMPPLSVFRQRQEKQDIFPSCMGPRAHYQEVAFRPFYITAEDQDFMLRVVEQWQHKQGATHRLADGLYAIRSRRKEKRPGLATIREHVFYDPWITIARAHRQNGLTDPTLNARTIDDAIGNIHPRFADTIQRDPPLTRTITDLIDICIVHALTDEHDTLTNHAEQLAQKCLRQSLGDYLRSHTISSDTMKSHLHHSIRHHERASYLALLAGIHQLSPESLRSLSPKVIFACLRRRRFSFILPLIKTLLRMKK